MITGFLFKILYILFLYFLILYSLRLPLNDHKYRGWPIILSALTAYFISILSPFLRIIFSKAFLENDITDKIPDAALHEFDKYTTRIALEQFGMYLVIGFIIFPIVASMSYKRARKIRRQKEQM